MKNQVGTLTNAILFYPLTGILLAHLQWWTWQYCASTWHDACPECVLACKRAKQSQALLGQGKQKTLRCMQKRLDIIWIRLPSWSTSCTQTPTSVLNLQWRRKERLTTLLWPMHRDKTRVTLILYLPCKLLWPPLPTRDHPWAHPPHALPPLAPAPAFTCASIPPSHHLWHNCQSPSVPFSGSLTTARYCRMIAILTDLEEHVPIVLTVGHAVLTDTNTPSSLSLSTTIKRTSSHALCASTSLLTAMAIHMPSGSVRRVLTVSGWSLSANHKLFQSLQPQLIRWHTPQTQISLHL